MSFWMVHALTRKVAKRLSDFLRSPNGLLVVSLAVFVVLSSFLLFIPIIGRHAWNEGIFSSMIEDLSSEHLIPFQGSTKPNFGNPHFFIFLSVIPRLIFGSSTFSYRLVSFFGGLVTLFAVSWICRSLGGFYRYAPLLVATIPVLLFYSARCQPEVIGLALFAFSFLFAVKAKRVDRVDWRFAVLSGLFAGLAIYTKFQFAIALVPIAVIFFSGNVVKGKLVAFKGLVLAAVFACVPYLLSIVAENALYPQYYPYKFFFGRLMILRYTEASTSSFVSVAYSSFVSTEFLVMSIPFVLGLFGLLVYVRDVLYQKGQRIALIEGSIALFVLYTALGLQQVSHFYVHEYLFLPLILSVVPLSIYLFNKLPCLLKGPILRFGSYSKYTALVVAALVGGSLFFGAINFYSFYVNPLGQAVPDGYGNMAAVKTGQYMSSLELEDNAVVLVQSDVMGVYSGQPYMTWYDIWRLNSTVLETYSWQDFVAASAFYDVGNVFDVSRDAQLRTVGILESWNFSCIVLSPEIYNIIGQSYVLHGYVYSNYVLMERFSPYYVFVSKGLIEV